MSETDLRFAFHMDTGSMPMWSYDHWMVKVLNHGHPTSEYGQWLEERAGNHRWLQRAFQFEHKKAPIYKSKNQSWTGNHRRGRRYYQWVIQNVYDPDYCFWLERRILEKNPEVVKNILHL